MSHWVWVINWCSNARMGDYLHEGQVSVREGWESASATLYIDTRIINVNIDVMRHGHGCGQMYSDVTLARQTKLIKGHMSSSVEEIILKRNTRRSLYETRHNIVQNQIAQAWEGGEAAWNQEVSERGWWFFSKRLKSARLAGSFIFISSAIKSKRRPFMHASCNFRGSDCGDSKNAL